MNSKKIVVGVILWILMLGFYLTLPNTITDNDRLYDFIRFAFVLLTFLGGLYVVR